MSNADVQPHANHVGTVVFLQDNNGEQQDDGVRKAPQSIYKINHPKEQDDEEDMMKRMAYPKDDIRKEYKNKTVLLRLLASCPISLGEFITIIGWFIATAMCIWYTIDASAQFITSMNNPTTSTSFVESLPLYFPAISIWNAVVDCDYCNLTLKFITKVNSELGTVETFEIPHDFVSIFQNGQLFSCYVFNNGTSLLVANSTGYAGTISFYFNVPPAPIERDARFGLQVSFHEPGTVPKVFSETNFAISGVDNYFILTKVLTQTLKPSVENPNTVFLRWESSLSIVELAEIDANVVVISVAYSSLNENKIQEVVTSSIEGLLGQIAGIIGIFMGMDILKLLRGVLEVPYAIKKKTVRGLWDNLN